MRVLGVADMKGIRGHLSRSKVTNSLFLVPLLSFNLFVVVEGMGCGGGRTQLEI